MLGTIPSMLRLYDACDYLQCPLFNACSAWPSNPHMGTIPSAEEGLKGVSRSRVGNGLSILQVVGGGTGRLA